MARLLEGRYADSGVSASRDECTKYLDIEKAAKHLLELIDAEIPSAAR